MKSMSSSDPYPLSEWNPLSVPVDAPTVIVVDHKNGSVVVVVSSSRIVMSLVPMAVPSRIARHGERQVAVGRIVPHGGNRDLNRAIAIVQAIAIVRRQNHLVARRLFVSASSGFTL